MSLETAATTSTTAPSASPTQDHAGCIQITVDYPVAPRERPWKDVPARMLLVAGFEAILPAAERLLRRVAGFQEDFLRIQARPGAQRLPGAAYWVNGWFPALDGATLYGLLALENPRWYVEVGSGNSTCFARQAIRDHGLRTRILSVDPFPRAEIDALCDQVHRVPLEEFDFFGALQLTSEDILFIDSSHRSFQNSDVTVFFEEILPALPPGLRYGIHDIYLPADYPQALADRFYNEQYLLSSYLAGGADRDEILLPNAYLFRETGLVSATLGSTFERLGLALPEQFGNSFWMQRDPAGAK